MKKIGAPFWDIACDRRIPCVQDIRAAVVLDLKIIDIGLPNVKIYHCLMEAPPRKTQRKFIAEYYKKINQD
jgi:hypothetical protein